MQRPAKLNFAPGRMYIRLTAVESFRNVGEANLDSCGLKKHLMEKFQLLFELCCHSCLGYDCIVRETQKRREAHTDVPLKDPLNFAFENPNFRF